MRPDRRAFVLAGLVGLGVLLLAGAVGLVGFLSFEDGAVERFHDAIDARGAAPTRVYARAKVLERRFDVERLELADYLARTGYRQVEAPPVRAGEFAVHEGTWTLGLRRFRFLEGEEPARTVTAELDRHGRIAKLRDADGEELQRVRLEPPMIAVLDDGAGIDQRKVTLDDLPELLPEAFLAIEDQRFYDHPGVDGVRIFGAMLANLRAGRVVQGGSTITQQLVKNVLLTRDRTLARKLEEAAIALAIERATPKDEILTHYLNEVYLGQRGAFAVHGVAAAARHYFGKDVSRLGAAECALLAALARGPSRYSPFSSPESAQERRNLVLAQLLEQGRLDPDVHAEAVRAPLGLRPQPEPVRSVAFFVDHLRREIAASDRPWLLERKGVRVFTTLDIRLQRLAEAALRGEVAALEQERPRLVREDAVLEGALVALDPQTGDVLALVGGRDYGRSQFDRATQARRQPGSVFKTVVALAALENHRDPTEPAFTLASVLADEPILVERDPTNPDEEDWLPRNHDEEFRGEVTVREAIEQSLNVPMIRLGMEIGTRRIVRTARRLGITARLRSVPSLALGTSEVSLLELTSAYAVLAAGGVRATPRILHGIQESGRLEPERTEVARTRAFPANQTYLVTSALIGVVKQGTGRRLGAYFWGDVAGKTGTSDEYRDGWFIGYTPELVAGVWVGFDDGEGLGVPGSRSALPVFGRFLAGALGRGGRSKFRAPAGLERMAVTAHRGYPAGVRCGDRQEWFLAGTGPSARCGALWLPPVGAAPAGGSLWDRLLGRDREPPPQDREPEVLRR